MDSNTDPFSRIICGKMKDECASRPRYVHDMFCAMDGSLTRFARHHRHSERSRQVSDESKRPNLHFDAVTRTLPDGTEHTMTTQANGRSPSQSHSTTSQVYTSTYTPRRWRAVRSRTVIAKSIERIEPRGRVAPPAGGRDDRRRTARDRTLFPPAGTRNLSPMRFEDLFASSHNDYPRTPQT